MAVHRISDFAEACLKVIAEKEGVKSGDFISQLISDYAAGHTFQRDEHGRACLESIKNGK